MKSNVRFEIKKVANIDRLCPPLQLFLYHISFSFFDMAAISSAISSEDSLM